LFMSIMCLVIVLQGVLHSIIDHFKANRLKINLIADQSLHMLQIAVSFCIFVMYIVG